MAKKTKKTEPEPTRDLPDSIDDSDVSPDLGDELFDEMDAFYDEANDDSNIGHPGHPSNHGDH